MLRDPLFTCARIGAWGMRLSPERPNTQPLTPPHILNCPYKFSSHTAMQSTTYSHTPPTVPLYHTTILYHTVYHTTILYPHTIPPYYTPIPYNHSVSPYHKYLIPAPILYHHVLPADGPHNSPVYEEGVSNAVNTDPHCSRRQL